MAAVHDNYSSEQQFSETTHQAFVSSKTVANVLAKVKPPPNRQVVDLPATATMEEALDLLLAEDILSVPVYRLENNQKIYITIVSVLDLLKLFVSQASLTDPNVLLKPISEAIGQTAESSTLVTVRVTDSLSYILDLFSQRGAHRVLVQAEEGPILLSQMDVIRYLHSHNHHLGRILDISAPTIISRSRTRRGVPENGEPVTSITFKSTALDAFLKMAHNPRITALPIVDDDETFVGDLSPQDLRGLNRDRFDALAKPVVMYLKFSHGDIYPAFTCHSRFTLSQLMASMVLRKAYRLWLCDDTGHVEGIITLSDILGAFAA
ncbi:hypothetical protein DFQ28_008185 [Apophysomyces sp. BC1034]|nr:hypothetical protein DFQ30_007907 [Apophysomyces sp. BC1015]KAG0176389.1 hypothetical protein DFQ29_006192 [Apophysomyces sp. BC1021]KAG0186198.1 hypothetical protein DFQ28_008185 [Apophysomyces sp. BC1034]